MEIIAKCPACKYAWRLDAGAVDKRIRCLNCSRLFKIPRLEEIPDAVRIIEGAKGPIYVDSKGRKYG